jgi:hypothetical protein
LNGTIPYFRSLFQFNEQIKQVENKLNFIQDSLYFTHRGLFSNRTQPLTIGYARQIMFHSQNYLPESIRHFGNIPPPPAYHTLDPSATIKDLQVYVRAKLLLYDKLPDTCVYTLSDGVLTILQPNVYELKSTLQYLHPQAPWQFLSFRFCIISHSASGTTDSATQYDWKLFEANVLQTLQRLSGEQRIWSTMMSDDHRATSTVIESKEDEYSNGETRTHLLTLTEVHGLCSHASISVFLRVMYVQSFQLKSSVFLNKLETDFKDNAQLSYVTVRFWNDQPSK